ncbi:MAG: ABC transporter permease subunit [Sulfurospirillaceae bacterium]|nr:ABC transporter permease subunit [Sulfurospirillaceae bacterium]MDD3462062.1 ABC transporter permease subunit [Sulfurospirillaceae bacterium]
MKFLFKFGLVVSVITTSSLVFLILAFLLYFSIPLFDSAIFVGFFTQKWDVSKSLYGLLPMILGTIYISVLATFFATAMSFSLASLSEGFLPKKIATVVEGIIVLLAGVPTVLYAFVALFLLVPLINIYFFMGKGLSIFTASFVLAFVVLPTIYVMMLSAFRGVPKKHIKTSLCLGATKKEVFFSIMLPQAKPALLGAIVFGFARSVGDTLIALMLSGNSLHMPNTLFDSARTLTSHIALINANDYESVAFKAIFLCALLLFIFTFFVVATLKYLYKEKRYA